MFTVHRSLTPLKIITKNLKKSSKVNWIMSEWQRRLLFVSLSLRICVSHIHICFTFLAQSQIVLSLNPDSWFLPVCWMNWWCWCCIIFYKYSWAQLPNNKLFILCKIVFDQETKSKKWMKLSLISVSFGMSWFDVYGSMLCLILL